MHRVVNTKTDSQDNVDSGENVDGETPEVHEATDVDEGEEDADEDHERRDDVRDEKEGSDEDADKGKPNVAVQLVGNHFVRLPGGVGLGEGKGPPGEVGLAQVVLDPVHGWNVFRRSGKELVLERDF